MFCVMYAVYVVCTVCAVCAVTINTVWYGFGCDDPRVTVVGFGYPYYNRATQHVRIVFRYKAATPEQPSPHLNGEVTVIPPLCTLFDSR